MKQFPVAILLAFLAAACASSLPYSADYPLSDATFKSRDGVFTGRIPLGWFSSTEDSLAEALTAWLIKEDYSAMLAVKEIKLDDLAARRVKKEGLQLLAHLNALMEGTTQPSAGLSEFQMMGRSYCSYEFSSAENFSRAVVFVARGRFYACTARTTKGTRSSDDVTGMFRAQQTFLSSLAY